MNNAMVEHLQLYREYHENNLISDVRLFTFPMTLIIISITIIQVQIFNKSIDYVDRRSDLFIS